MGPGLLRHAGPRGDGGFVIFIAMFIVIVVLVTALSLCQVVLQPQLIAERAVQRNVALDAALAGLEQSKQLVGHSLIFTDPAHSPISASGTLNRATYTVNVVYIGGVSVQITSTGKSGTATCVLTRNCLAAPDASKLRVINYVGSDTIKFQSDITSLNQRAPLQLSAPVELPNFNYWRALAKAQDPGHYFSGDQTFGPHADLNGVYFSEGNMTIKNSQVAVGTP